MKKGIIIFMYVILLPVYSCVSGGRNDKVTFIDDADYVQIVLFHLAQRCESCTAVEQETQSLLSNEYTEEIASGEVKFISLNFQSENGKNAARILKASGQTLFVVHGDSVSDLTSSAFMFASTHPERYREALRKALDNAFE